METKWTITTIKAEPGYMIVDPVNSKAPFTDTAHKPVIAWEIQRYEDFSPPYCEGDFPVNIRTEVVAISDEGYRMDVPLVGVKRPDGSCLDCDRAYRDEQHMLRSWNGEPDQE